MPILLKKCPNCRSKNGVKIVYGKPTPQLVALSEKKKVYIGDCTPQLTDPQYHCYSCQHQWTKEEAIEAAYKEIQHITFSIGGYFQGEVNYKIDFETGQILKRVGQTNEETSTSFQIAIERQRLIRTNLLDWKAQYVQKEIMDGEQWSIEIVTQSSTTKKYGSNQYPRDWGLFCYFIDQLMNEQQFKSRYNVEKAKFELNFRIPKL